MSDNLFLYVKYLQAENLLKYIHLINIQLSPTPETVSSPKVAVNCIIITSYYSGLCVCNTYDCDFIMARFVNHKTQKSHKVTYNL